MTHDSAPPQLDADALDLLSALRAEQRIPDQLHDRVWDRVHASVHAQAPTRWSRRGAIVGVLVAASLAMLWVGAQAVSSTTRQKPASQAGYERGGDPPAGHAEQRSPQAAHETSAPAETTSEPAPASAVPTAPEVELDQDGDEAPAARGESRGATRSSRASKSEAPAQPEPAPTLADTLSEENRLLSQARAALLDERPEAALSQLDEHARRFPSGVLEPEREALRAVALCEAGREAQGVPAARSFLRAHPQSALAQRVRGACLK